MALPVADINGWAVLVSTIVGMILGGLWYSPVLFGNIWARLSGFGKKEMQAAKKQGMAWRYIGQFIFLLLSTYVLAHFVDYVSATSASAGASLAFWLWLGFILPLQIGSVLWENKSIKLLLINTGHYLVLMVIAGIILAIWA
ncbi:DUF1761 domain-containing protein [Candidatus Pacearchaeota archaeon]|nr:DUF1761 domain-containing protein [Candidatus Pacearchaeota archaeon]